MSENVDNKQKTNDQHSGGRERSSSQTVVRPAHQKRRLRPPLQRRWGVYRPAFLLSASTFLVERRTSPDKNISAPAAGSARTGSTMITPVGGRPVDGGAIITGLFSKLSNFMCACCIDVIPPVPGAKRRTLPDVEDRRRYDVRSFGSRKLLQRQ